MIILKRFWQIWNTPWKRSRRPKQPILFKVTSEKHYASIQWKRIREFVGAMTRSGASSSTKGISQYSVEKRGSIVEVNRPGCAPRQEGWWRGRTGFIHRRWVWGVWGGGVVNQPFNGQPSTTPICHLIALFGRLHSHCLFIVNVWVEFRKVERSEQTN